MNAQEADQLPTVAQFIEDFHLYADNLSDTDTSPDSLTPAPPTSMPPPPASPINPHQLLLTVPGDLWFTLEQHCPYRGITRFIVQAAREKLAHPYIPDLITAAGALARITDELLLTAEDPPANAGAVLAQLHELLSHFD